ncbi:MAG: threonine--tRNA ligase [Candidatus Latescibacteria bacterium]|nr:threonine--tRNA ligase [bacterium]MBD3423260.1 threonine--tRNA ligase [Candidatus Latescibacterota bacterium]
MSVLEFPDGSSNDFPEGAVFFDVLSTLPRSVQKNAVAVKLDGDTHDLREEIDEDGSFVVITGSDSEALEVLRHSASHLMALAVKELYGDVIFGIGPAIQDGFYYDLKLDHTFTPDDLEKIEKKMEEIRKENPDFVRKTLSRDEAMEFFREENQPFKVELIEDLDAEEVTIYTLGSFTDLCAGPHVPDIRMVKAFKLLSVAGAYWRGDENREMFQRIYGTSFGSKTELEESLRRIEEAKKRDHRKLGSSMDLFNIYEEAGGGLVFWHPRGYTLRETIENYWKQKHREKGYDIIMTPHIARSDLWKQSGHYDYYRENMFVIKGDDEEEMVLKPMNCPYHILIYKRELRSYRDLPIRYAELGTVYRNERSGTLHGLLRVRGFTQDDAHIFCSPEQLDREIDKCFDLAHEILSDLGFSDYEVELSAHDPEKLDQYAGSREEWVAAENALRKAIEKRDLEYSKIEGEAVFYGPKIDLKLIDALGRGWQATTIQFDFNLPRRFDITYVNENNEKKYVYMIHRALLGSLERFIGCLTEHYAGKFPLWLAPVQVRILPVSEHQKEYAEECLAAMIKKGIRAEVDSRNEKLGYRIRAAEVDNIPYMIIVGDREIEEGMINIRSKSTGREGSLELEKFINDIVDEIEKKG